MGRRGEEGEGEGRMGEDVDGEERMEEVAKKGKRKVFYRRVR